jgi:alpha-methylacyl-CoA racemase
MNGPLAGVKVMEFAGLGPVPFAGAILADLGAYFVYITRPGVPADPDDPQLRGKHSVMLDLKSAEGRKACLEIAAHCDILLEGFRPGVMERLGLGPDDLSAANEKIIYARMTGWGQEGPLASRAGHDVNYLAVTGVLHAIGPAEKPAIPLNLIGDFGGGSMFLLTGVLAALHQAKTTGKGSVLDVAMIDGIAALASSITYKQSQGRWALGRGVNYLDGASSRYSVYECADGKFVALGAIEPQFYEEFRSCLGLQDPAFDLALEPDQWPAQRTALMQVFRTRARDEWIALCEGRDCCLSPVLDLEEARAHPHAVARQAFRQHRDGILPVAAPRLSGHSASTEPPSETSLGDALAALKTL